MRILVVEDYPDIALMFQAFLADSDDGQPNEVVTRTYGFEALVRDMHSFDGIDAAVIDHHLRSKVTGCDIAKVAARAGVAKVVIVTADQTLDCAPIPRLLKPITRVELREAVLDG